MLSKALLSLRPQAFLKRDHILFSNIGKKNESGKRFLASYFPGFRKMAQGFEAPVEKFLRQVHADHAEKVRQTLLSIQYLRSQLGINQHFDYVLTESSADPACLF